MQLVLEKREKSQLLRAYKCGNRKERESAQVILLHADGWSASKIASTLKLDHETVSAYLAEYSGWKPKYKKHTVECPLDDKQTKDLIAHIEATPTISVRKIIEHIEQRYGHKRTEHAVGLWLKAHGFSHNVRRVPCYYTTPNGHQTLVYRSVSGWYRDQETIPAFSSSSRPNMKECAKSEMTTTKPMQSLGV